MSSQRTLDGLEREILACTACTADFSLTFNHHRPRPVPWLSIEAKLLIAGQAPGTRVHETGIPFNDRSGDRLRDWLGLDRDQFYDRCKLAILPMAFCFPGQDAKGGDLPPPPRCAALWRDRSLAAMPQIELTLLIGLHAQKWALGRSSARSLTENVRNWQQMPDGIVPLPHPSWRNNGWIRKNPWFETELLPDLRAKVAALM